MRVWVVSNGKGNGAVNMRVFWNRSAGVCVRVLMCSRMCGGMLWPPVSVLGGTAALGIIAISYCS